MKSIVVRGSLCVFLALAAAGLGCSSSATSAAGGGGVGGTGGAAGGAGIVASGGAASVGGAKGAGVRRERAVSRARVVRRAKAAPFKAQAVSVQQPVRKRSVEAHLRLGAALGPVEPRRPAVRAARP
jgi:hypothetical protein